MRQVDIRSLCEQRGWSRTRLIHEMRRHADRAGVSLPGDESLRRMLKMWAGGGRRPSPVYAELLAAIARGSGPGRGTTAVPAGGDPAAAMLAFRLADPNRGGGRMYGEVVEYLHREIAPHVFGADRDVEGVFDAAAALTEMAGWMAHDAGRDTHAARHFRQASALSELGNDTQLRAHIQAARAGLACHHKRPREASALVRQGLAACSDGSGWPGVESQLFAIQARAAALGRDGRQCARLLADAEEALVRASNVAMSPWINRFDEASLAGEAVRALAALGDHAGATEQARTILAIRTDPTSRAHAFGRLALARAMIGLGDTEQAAGEATGVLRSTTGLASSRVVVELGELARALVGAGPSAPPGFAAEFDAGMRRRRGMLNGLDPAGTWAEDA